MLLSIVKIKKEDAFKYGSNIAFAFNADGNNKNSFIEIVASKFWPKLLITGPQELGTVLICKIEGRILSNTKKKIMRTNLFGLVCRQNFNGVWQALSECLSLIKIPQNQDLVLVVDNNGSSIDSSEDIIASINSSKHYITLVSL
jgi:hypothetical protein